MLTWIVVEVDAPRVIGVCQTAMLPVFAASAEPANASVAVAAAAMSVAWSPVLICGCPFVAGSSRSLQRLAEHIPEAVEVTDEIRLPQREIIRRRRGDRQTGEQERVGLVQMGRGLQQARPRRVLARMLERVDHRIR